MQARIADVTGYQNPIDQEPAHARGSGDVCFGQIFTAFLQDRMKLGFGQCIYLSKADTTSMQALLPFGLCTRLAMCCCDCHQQLG